MDKMDGISEKDAWIALNMIEGISPQTFFLIINNLGSPKNIFQLDRCGLEGIPYLSTSLRDNIYSYRIERLENEKRLIERHGVEVCTFLDTSYPEPLKKIPHPPPVLYIKGKFCESDKNAIAIVGARKATSYGTKIAKDISCNLTKYGFTIISGMAVGIDYYAHKGALDGGGRTIAVLGCGISIDYPKENAVLKDKILNNGAIISEFPMSTAPFKGNFPRRNRIISGLAFGTLVVEAASKSGSLITAYHALEQGREVFAVPGNIASPLSKGTNNLIKAGAKLVDTEFDIINELPEYIKARVNVEIIYGKTENNDIDLTREEEIIYNILGMEEQHIDYIVEESGMPSSFVSAILMQMELKGIIKQLNRMSYIRIR